MWATIIPTHINFPSTLIRQNNLMPPKEAFVLATLGMKVLALSTIVTALDIIK